MIPLTEEQARQLAMQSMGGDYGVPATLPVAAAESSFLGGAPPPPTEGGAPPPIPGALGAAQPAPLPAPLVDPQAGQAAPSSDLRDKLIAMGMQSHEDNSAISRDAGGMLGPLGDIAKVETAALNQSRAAGQEQVGAEQADAVRQKDLYDKAAEKDAIAAAGQQARKEAFEKRAADLQRTADVWSQQAQAMEVKDFWADKSTGSRLLGILAQTLSGAANGLAGNPGAPSPLDRIIDRDFEVQKHNLANKQAGAIRAEGALGQAYNNFKDENEAELAARDAAYKQVAIKSKAYAAQMGGETAHAKDQMVQAAMQQKLAENQTKRAEIAQRGADSRDAQAQGLLAEQARDQSNEAQTDMTAQGRNQGIGVPGVDVPVPKSFADGQWRKTSGAFSEGFAGLDALEAQAKKGGLSFVDKHSVDVINTMLEGSMRGILGTGANLSEYERKSIQQVGQSYLKGRVLSDLTPLEQAEFIHASRKALANVFRARVRGTFKGADLTRDPGFESAYDSVHEEDAAQ